MDILIDFFKKNLFHHNINIYIGLTLAVVLLGLFTWIVGYISKNYLALFLNTLLKKATNNWIILINKCGFVEKIAQIGQASFLYWGIEIISFKELPFTATTIEAVKTLTLVYMLFIAARSISCSIDVIYEHYQDKNTRNRPMKGYAQIFKIILWFLTVIFSISILIDKSPWVFLTGLGAISAVLVIVFKDTILGFVANIQVSAYDLVRVGDWITIDQHGVDGTVFDISVNTVKVRNFDNTIATIPTYDLVSCNVQNWRGMTESGGRRIKNSIKIDMSTIQFIDESFLDKINQSRHIKQNIKILLNKYIDNTTESDLTNLCAFRYYVQAYLHTHKDIHSHMTLLVRYLQPSETGLPLEIYAFTNTTIWMQYENVIATTFEHLLAVLPLFKLKPFQVLSNSSLTNISNA